MTKGKKQLGGTGRCRIEFGLSAGESARSIAKALGVSLSTVTREIGKHTYESFKGCYGCANQCAHRQDCRLTGVCGDCPANGAPCVRCSYRNCSRFCDRVEYIDCALRLLRTAKVCNGCPDEKRCRKRTLFYVAALSHVNAYIRYAQGDRTPCDVFEFLYGEGTAAKLHIANGWSRPVV